MRSIIEFALFAWVGISVVAVLTQLIRIARYKRANGATPSTETQASKPEAARIDLGERLAPARAADAPAADAAPSEALAGAHTAEQTGSSSAATQATPSVSMPAAPTMPAAPARPTPPEAPTPPASDPVNADPVAAEAPPAEAGASSDPAPTAEATPEPATPEPAAPTLADLLAGVRLPWNLLPTVDQSREPSNDRVVLITSEGEPADIGIDVADELERLGFAIAPRGDDTAIATRGSHSLGLQIIENPMAAEIDGTRRFPTATESSVALDIWIE